MAERFVMDGYMPDMEVIDSTVEDGVAAARAGYDPDGYTAAEVLAALASDRRTVLDYAALLSPAAEPFLEEMARKARAERRRYFGNAAYMFTPLYLANYCENRCVYCGFNSGNAIRRAWLRPDEIEREMAAIARSGLREILLLTGESRRYSDVEYIGRACEMARRYFQVVGLEVYPLNSEEYAYLHGCGADFVTVFQETYDSSAYAAFHLDGPKRFFGYRFNAQERALRGGMRGVGLAALLGLADFRRDAFAAGIHAALLQRRYPQAEIAMSCPRLRPIVNNDRVGPRDVGERQLMQVILAYRLFLPFANITISTRERARFRDNVLDIAATKISAGVSVGVGSHSADGHRGDEQFAIADQRGVEEIYAALRARGLQPVMQEYVYV